MFVLARACRHLSGSFCLAASVLLLAVTTAPAALPTDTAARAALIGQPASLHVQPESITLTGPRAVQQLVVTGQYADGSVRDLTPFCELTPEAADLVAVEEGGFLVPRKSGTTTLVVTAGG